MITFERHLRDINFNLNLNAQYTNFNDFKDQPLQMSHQQSDLIISKAEHTLSVAQDLRGRFWKSTKRKCPI